MKMVIETQKNIKDLELFRKRLEILSGAKLREIDSITSAVLVQDNIRAKTGKWNGSKEIRKWRNKR